MNDAGVWVADEASNSVVQIDAKSKEVVSRIAVAGKPTWMRAFDGWDVFVGLSDPAGIVRIDPARKAVFGPEIPAFGTPKSIIFVKGAIWFVDSTGETLSKVDLNPIGKPGGRSRGRMKGQPLKVEK